VKEYFSFRLEIVTINYGLNVELIAPFSESLNTQKAMFDANSTYATRGRDPGINNHRRVYAERNSTFPSSLAS
jgi:hypothetical protein